MRLGPYDSYERHHVALARTGFFGEQAAGCIVMARSTMRILLLKRSALVEEAGTWGNPGGAHHPDEAPADAALRELREETGYTGTVEMHPLRAFEQGSFRYSNFHVFVDEEFAPKLNWESDDYQWCHLHELPEPLHFGLRALFGERLLSSDEINEMHEHVSRSRARHVATPAQREWLAGSTIVDADGEPLIAYHGSAWSFDRFDVTRAGSARGFPTERALFFSFDPWTATHSAISAGATYADGRPTDTGAFADNSGVVYPVYLRAENPCVSTLAKYESSGVAAHLKEARESGFDAVIFPHIQTPGENGTIAVFRADQVRSIYDE